MEIAFPVYKLRTDKPVFENGVHYYFYEKYNEETDELIPVLRVIDDKSIDGNTLAHRRLLLKSMGVPLFRIKYSVFFLGDFIKMATPSLWFVDSLGKVFNYKKSARAKLKFYKITKLFNIPKGGCIIEVEGMMTRFKSLFPPTRETPYAGVLQFGKSLVLYGYYDQKYDDTWRMV